MVRVKIEIISKFEGGTRLIDLATSYGMVKLKNVYIKNLKLH